MDVHPNVTVPSGFSDPWDFLPDSNNKDGTDDYSTLEWLSVYVEDCLTSGTTTYCTQPQPSPKPETVSVNPDPVPSLNSDPPTNSELFKRRRGFPVLCEEPPLLPNRTEWLADSEPMYPLRQPKLETPDSPPKKKIKVMSKPKEEKAQRRCTHCLSNKTPQWREGPMGPKTLCNACGVRFKSGRLLPEYRPAKSPTFVSWMHSNSHKKVMEMRKSNDIPSNSD